MLDYDDNDLDLLNDEGSSILDDFEKNISDRLVSFEEAMGNDEAKNSNPLLDQEEMLMFRDSIVELPNEKKATKRISKIEPGAVPCKKCKSLKKVKIELKDTVQALSET